MNNSNKLLCLKESLIKSEVTAKVLLQAIYNCARYDKQLGLSKENLDKAHDIIVLHKDNLPKNAEGKRYFHGDDEIRDEISRLLFGIPLKNLRRKEERILSENPVMSAAFDKSAQAEQVSHSNMMQVKSTQPKEASTYTVQHFSFPDESAFDGYVGNTDVVKTVELQINGAHRRGDVLRPMLLRGVSGCGKTELGIRIARRIGKPFYYVSASILKTADDVDRLYDAVEEGSVVFIDEIQAAGEKAKARILTKQSTCENGSNKEIAFIFATNLSGKLPDAFRNRCVQLKLSDYTIDELMSIIFQTAKANGVELENSVAKYISERCHGIARFAVDYTRDIIMENATEQCAVTIEQAKEFFSRRGIDSYGLSAEHRKYIYHLFHLGQASAKSLASALGENDVAEIEKSIEPLLLKNALITISSRGRYLTEKGVEYAQSLKRGI